MLVFHWNISHFHVPILHRYIWMVYVYISFLLSLTFKHHDDHENIMDFLRRCRILSHFQSLQVRDWPDRGLREENSPILRKLWQEIQQPRREFSLLCFALLCFALRKSVPCWRSGWCCCLKGPRFNPELRVLSVWSFTHAPRVQVSSGVLPFPKKWIGGLSMLNCP